MRHALLLALTFMLGCEPSGRPATDSGPDANAFVYEVRLLATGVPYEIRADDTVVMVQPAAETIIRRTFATYAEAKAAEPIRLETWAGEMRIDARSFRAGACDTLCDASACEFGQVLDHERVDVKVTEGGTLEDYVESMSCLLCRGEQTISRCL
jgi:hypothetical protein